MFDVPAQQPKIFRSAKSWKNTIDALNNLAETFLKESLNVILEVYNGLNWAWDYWSNSVIG